MTNFWCLVRGNWLISGPARGGSDYQCKYPAVHTTWSLKPTSPGRHGTRHLFWPCTVAWARAAHLPLVRVEFITFFSPRGATLSYRFAVMIVALCSGTSAFAQGVNPLVQTDPLLSAAIGRIPLSAPVRVSFLSNWAEGTLLRASRDSIHVQIGSTVQPLALATLDSLSVRRRSTWRGAAFGTFVGTGVAILAGLAYEGKKVPFATGCECGQFPRHAAVIGVVGGAAIGAALGRRHYRWHRVYP